MLSLYEEQRNWADIALFAGMLLDYYCGDLTPSMLEVRERYEKEMPDFTGYLKQALSGGVEMKAVRTAVIKFTDVRMDEPAGGTRSFKDIYLHLAELFGEF